MKLVYQTKFGDPEGNCFAACVASILECEITELPDFDDLPEGCNWLEWFNEHLAPKGYGVISATVPLHAYVPSGAHFIAAGPGHRGIKHCVVMKSSGELTEHTCDELAHDPYPNGHVGLERMDDICLIVKL